MGYHLKIEILYVWYIGCPEKKNLQITLLTFTGHQYLADSNTAKIVRDHFKQFIDSDDALMVSEVNNWASYNAKNTPNDL